MAQQFRTIAALAEDPKIFLHFLHCIYKKRKKDITLDSSQLPITQAPWDPTPSSGLCGHLHTHGIYSQRHNHMHNIFFYFPSRRSFSV